MTPLTNFHSLFEPHIITRGKGYLNNVVQLKNDFGNHWIAFVKGTHRYKVEIELSQNGWGDVLIKQMYCSCEYWDNCKHQVAVLLKLQEKLKNNELKINNKEQIPALQQLLEQSDKQTLINFILQPNQNQPIENEFLLFVNKNTNVQTNSTQINKAIQQKISDILTLDDENEWEEFVFDEQIDELTQLLSEFDHQPTYQMTVAITWIDNILAIYEDIFDEIADSIVLCLECLAKHLLNVENYWVNWDNCFVELNYQDNEMIENLFILLEDWRQAITRVSYTICPEIERFYFDLHWAYGNQTIATDYLDELLVMTEQHNHHDFDKILTIKIQALKALNQPVEHLMKKYLHLPKVFTLKVETLSANGEASQAIALLKERLKTDNNIIWHKKLVEIGQKINDTILIREHSVIVMSANLTLDVDYLNIYKNTFNQNEWQQQKPIIA